MKLSVYMPAICIIVVPGFLCAQSTILEPGKSIERKLLKGENHVYTIALQKGEHAECVVMQKGVDLAIDVTDPSGKKFKTFDSPNGTEGPEPVAIEALHSGTYKLHIYPLMDQPGMTDSAKAIWTERNQGDYRIEDVTQLSAAAYKQKLAQILQDKDQFTQWIISNAHTVKTVDAGNGFEDLQPFKTILQNVRVVGLGEASHGTSEFFRMKHRMLEFLVKEMGFTSFYIEASMTRCRYVNEYVLYGKGNLDTATTIQGFITWRVEEVRNMIEWMRQYNASVPDEKKVKFVGFDLQINNTGWKELKEFYKKVNPEKPLDSLQAQFDSGIALVNASFMNRTGSSTLLLDTAYQKTLDVMDDIVLNEGRYELLTSKEVYERNLLNIKLIIQQIKSFKEGANEVRDYFMAENILYLLNNEGPNAKVVVWAHNLHIAKGAGSMGGYLANALKQNYYAIGFEFYSGSFQTTNMDLHHHSHDWDVMTVGAPPEESLAWYFNRTGKDKFFIDFRNTGADKIKNFSLLYDMHMFGSIYSTHWAPTSPFSLTNFDGMIYIKESTAAKNFTKVYLDR